MKLAPSLVKHLQDGPLLMSGDVARSERLSQYRIAECDLMAAQEHFRSATEDLERITKAMAKEKPTTQAGGRLYSIMFGFALRLA